MTKTKYFLIATTALFLTPTDSGLQSLRAAGSHSVAVAAQYDTTHVYVPPE